MNVIHLLHKDSFAENRKHILLLLPQGVIVLSLPFLMPQFRERTLILLLFQIINHSPTCNSLEVTEHVSRLVWTTGEQVHVIEHYYVSKDQELARVACFVNRLAGNNLDCVGLKHWQSIFSDYRDV